MSSVSDADQIDGDSTQEAQQDVLANLFGEGSATATPEGEDSQISHQSSSSSIEKKGQVETENPSSAPVAAKVGLLDPTLVPHYKKSAVTVFKIWCVMVLGILLVVSVFFGSLYNREARYRNLHISVYLDQDEVVDGLRPYIADTLNAAMTTNEYIASLAGWDVTNSSTLTDRYTGLPFEDAITQDVYTRKIWGVIYVQPNATYNMYQAFKNGSTSFNASELIKVYYISSRDVGTVYEYVMSSLFYMENYFLELTVDEVYLPILNLLNSTEKDTLINQNSKVLLSRLAFQVNDQLPFLHTITTGPTNVGLIILIIVSFFQFNFFLPVHQSFAPKLLKHHYIIYRMICSQLSYLVLSFAFTCVCAAFRIDFNTSVGRGGFLACFCTLYLAMACVGGMNENMALVCFATYPPLIGFWLLFWVMSNIAPTFSAIAVCPHFYRYGYAFPIHNCNEILKVLLLNNWKGELGRNYGVLVAWWVITNCLLPITLTFFAKRMAKKH